MLITRRGLLGGFAALLAAPAIVRAASLMPVKVIDPRAASYGIWKRYSGYEALEITPSSVLEAATFNIRQAVISISMSGLEQLESGGHARIVDLLGTHA